MESDHLRLYLQLPPTKSDAYVVGEREQLHRVWINEGLEGVLVITSKSKVTYEAVKEIMKAIADEEAGGIGKPQGLIDGLAI